MVGCEELLGERVAGLTAAQAVPQMGERGRQPPPKHPPQERSMTKIVAYITSDAVRDADDVPMYEDGKRAFYWGAWPDSPVPNVRVWVLFDTDVTREAAFEAASG